MKNNKGKIWTSNDVSKLKELAKKGTDTPDIAKELGRTEDTIYTKASEKSISLMPKDK